MFVTPCSLADIEIVNLSIANKRCGLDNILVKIYKHFVHKIGSVIAFIFSPRVEHDIFPDSFKCAENTLTFKYGSSV